MLSDSSKPVMIASLTSQWSQSIILSGSIVLFHSPTEFNKPSCSRRANSNTQADHKRICQS